MDPRITHITPFQHCLAICLHKGYKISIKMAADDYKCCCECQVSHYLQKALLSRRDQSVCCA